MYCLRYSTSHAARSSACHNTLLQGRGSSVKPPHCGRPAPCSMLKMWMMSTMIIAVLVMGVNEMDQVAKGSVRRNTVRQIQRAPISPTRGLRSDGYVRSRSSWWGEACQPFSRKDTSVCFPALIKLDNSLCCVEHGTRTRPSATWSLLPSRRPRIMYIVMAWIDTSVIQVS